MDTLVDLFDFVMRNRQTVVFGNLGRLPHVVSDFLNEHHRNRKVLIVSKYYGVPVSNDNFRQVEWIDAGIEKCDLLIFMEPNRFDRIAANYANAARTVVFTSHLYFDHCHYRRDDGGGGGIFVWYFHTHPHDRVAYAERVNALNAMREGSEETAEVRLVLNHIQHESKVVIGPSTHSEITVLSSQPGGSRRTTDPPLSSNPLNFVVVDVSKVRDPGETFLRVWDAFDYMLANLRRVENWSVCFGLQAKNAYDNFCQESINRLFCQKQFENDLKDILIMLPFYQSGTIEWPVEMKVNRFGHLKYVCPKTLNDAFKLCLKYDLKPLVGGIYQIE